ncbi:cytochrome c biogenesis heme-transporting ATPase CcmA [Burkholderia singularis]|uniref:cytochrome c biogenesis heme-transporting ATPase CcmA n=1 Tax=Burkholderia singularis TaxID=1503053 RepID=UPI0021146C5B|nr:cytochrome c biogenesis heme-transporting ATPase CcmA [Burkholderia singularis]
MTAIGLACRRGNKLLFKDLDLSVGAGEILWVRGHNGSGKTSLLKLAAGLSLPETGQISWGGVPVRQADSFRRQLIYVAHSNALKEDLTVSEALTFLLRIHDRPSDNLTVHAALQAWDLQSQHNAMVRTLSQGQRRRVTLARLTADDRPSLWILDEPFDALDTDGVARLCDTLHKHASCGGTTLLTSHQAVDIGMLRPKEINLDRYC